MRWGTRALDTCLIWQRTASNWSISAKQQQDMHRLHTERSLTSHPPPPLLQPLSTALPWGQFLSPSCWQGPATGMPYTWFFFFLKLIYFGYYFVFVYRGFPHSFLQFLSTALCGCTKFCSITLLCVSIYFISNILQLQTMLQWITSCMCISNVYSG